MTTFFKLNEFQQLMALVEKRKNNNYDKSNDNHDIFLHLILLLGISQQYVHVLGNK